ncbi:hypothetical protein AB835_08610 [Candidatus Endobugula sertula]|uniref:NAD-dependent epimerase/dehydratase domain-containing protein n=1 Tax=Candidatus Endobugula sertula TaxID=62101 RepID=A0A1D2QPG6_9GAMM|nr:hypothetical protein AB835_08610 [Candidatus Endobugula sertula]
MKILITGVRGFIGAALVRHLMRDNTYNNIEIYCLQRPGTQINISGVWVIPLKVLSIAGFVDALSGYKFDYVFNLASYGVSRGDADLSHLIEGNISYLVYLIKGLEFAPRLIVNIGSCSEYGQVSGGIRVLENTPPAPKTTYGAAKVASGIFATTLASECNYRLINLRLFGVYGEGEARQRLLPYVVRKLTSNEPVNLTSGLQVRDWLYIDDVSSALVSLLSVNPEQIASKDSYNLCSGIGVTVRQVVERICEELEKPTDLLRWGALQHTGEPSWLVGDPSAFYNETNWIPSISLNDGISKAVSYYAR